MVIYGVAMVPLAERLREEAPRTMQAWYADDSAVSGKASDIGRVVARLCELGPAYGYYPEPAKSVVVSRQSQRAGAERHLQTFGFRYSLGKRYLGSFVGSDATRDAWLRPKVEAWANGVRALARVARRYPQAAYAGLTKSLQCEWQFTQRVTPDSARLFEPVENALRNHFVPALLGDGNEVEHDLRILTSLGVKQAGVGIADPTATADACFAASEAATMALTKALLDGTPLDVAAHNAKVRRANADARKARVAV